MLSLVFNLNDLSVTCTIEQVDCVIVDITEHGGKDSPLLDAFYVIRYAGYVNVNSRGLYYKQGYTGR